MARDDFMGADFCYGDRRIVSLGKDQGSTGNAAIWKALGFNHHITLVDRELAALLGEPHEGANTMLKHAIIALSLLSLPAATQAQDAGRANDSRNNHGPEHAHGSQGPHGEIGRAHV